MTTASGQKWTCQTCSSTIQLSSKYYHIKSIKHQKKLVIAPIIAKVKNSDTGRDIVVNGLTFKNLVRNKYTMKRIMRL